VVKALEEHFLGGTYANWYVSPVGGCAFAPHNDMEDNFIVQLEGQKLWRVYNHSGPLDLVNYGKYSIPADQMVLKKVALEVMMQPGDVLFVPRGMYHEASVASGTTLSSHITYAAACSIYWGMVFQYLISIVGARTIEKEAELRVELKKPLFQYSEVTWQALLVTAVEEATATNVDLRRRIALDSLKSIKENEQGKQYITHLENIMKLSIRHVYGDFYTHRGENGTFVDEELVKRFDNGTGVFDQQRHNLDVAHGEGLLSRVLTGADLYSAVKHIEDVQRTKLLASKREVTPTVDFLRCGEAKSCEACSATGCSWCISRRKCVAPRDTCGTDANAVGISGGHSNCSATRPFTTEENGIETTSRSSLAAEICSARSSCNTCLGAGCAYDFRNSKCVLVGTGQPVVSSTGVYKTCAAFYDFVQKVNEQGKHEKACPRHKDCGSCLGDKCAWCIGTDSCAGEGEMRCASSQDEVSRFDGLRKTCPVDTLNVADAPPPQDDDKSSTEETDQEQQPEPKTATTKDVPAPKKEEKDDKEERRPVSETEKVTWTVTITEAPPETAKEETSWAGAAAAAMGLGSGDGDKEL